MEGPQPGKTPDNEYMAMDPDQWEDQDDTYENGDNLGIDKIRREVLPVPGGATQLTHRTSWQTNDTLNRPQINNLPLPSRYMTIRWPPPKGNIGSAKTEQLVSFQRAIVGLVLLCLLLLAVVLSLSIACDILAVRHNQTQTVQIGGIGLQCGPKYYISDTENQTSKTELFVLNCEKFKEYLNRNSFVLQLQSNSCTWQCEC
ncbi:uncharacterized protein LOC122831624 [Gambusia affinis]|uniref:uncharacterized protein LOC122831624 n=1 Tax=Gambusia affinis TaxID=33528 RepID=UPI001CDD7FBB|nr:uncharacterized protein LOC122831624 [Gambusia affinis]